jgi:hypothetical protein
VDADAVKTKGSIFELVYRRLVVRLGHAQAIGAIAHRLCRLVWKILHDGVAYDERGPGGHESPPATPCGEDDPGTPKSRCTTFLEALGQYRREWNDRLGQFGDQPVHDWASHPADMFRYAAVVEDKMRMSGRSVHPHHLVGEDRSRDAEVPVQAIPSDGCIDVAGRRPQAGPTIRCVLWPRPARALIKDPASGEKVAAGESTSSF